MHTLNDDRLNTVSDFFEKENIEYVYPMHCSGKFPDKKFNRKVETFDKIYF